MWFESGARGVAELCMSSFSEGLEMHVEQVSFGCAQAAIFFFKGESGRLMAGGQTSLPTPATVERLLHSQIQS